MAYSDLRIGRYSALRMTYHITTVTRNRAPVFRDFHAARSVVIQLKMLHDEGRAETLCYVLMPDHLHWLMTLRAGGLSDAVRRLKGRTAHAIGRPVWQPNYYDHGIRSDEDLRKLARYIVANPLRSGLVDRIGAYPWWDSIWLDAGLSG
ncbi:MAG: transposase [Methylotetracoccus sp.]|jgi:REP element-mobilizing transposase RayT|nr:transposase [Methylotetracoccus sp.]